MNRIKYPDTVEIINHNPDDLQDITNDIRIKLSARDDDKVEGDEEYPTENTPDILVLADTVISYTRL